MKFLARLIVPVAVFSMVAIWGATSSAVLIGQSALIGKLDYADSYTLGINGRNNATVYVPANSGLPQNTVEQNFGNPSRQWQIITAFAHRDLASDFGDLGGGSGNTGNTTGFWETGSGDVAFQYGLSNNYTVQVDAVLPGDRLDIGSFGAVYTGIGSANSLSVFFRRDSSALPSIGLYNGAVETDTGFLTGIGAADNNWHNFAVNFNHFTDKLAFYVDQNLVGTLDLTTFAGGIYQNYGNNFVGHGGTFVTEVDNFQVGAPVPEPSTIISWVILAMSCIGLLVGRRFQRCVKQ
jgi:hypothetical protein